MSRRNKVHGWQLTRDLAIAGAGALFSMWVTLAVGYQAMILALAGVIGYSFIKAYRERTGQVTEPKDWRAAA